MYEPVELKQLKSKILQYNPDCDWDKIVDAYLFAKEAHEGQKRHSGEPYIVHPLSVAEILTEVEADDKTIIAGLLHDVVEDTEYTIEYIEEQYGQDVAVLIEGVTKLGKVKGRTKSEQKMENIRKMILAMATDIRVIIVKLADRLHNMRTLQFHSSETKRRQIAQETLDIYSPLANRLGVFQFKWELEDLCLQVLEPEKYTKLVNDLASTRDARLSYIQQFIDQLGEKLKEAGIPYIDIYGRSKNLYSIYRKMLTQNKELPQIYDVLAVRVIVNNVTECYSVLGVVHSLCVPVPGRFKDYIAMPKQNMYQSIHTTIIGPNGKPLEVQIRTEEMHHVAEHGIAAHWQYKEGKSGSKPDQKLAWLRQMLDWQKEIKDADEFMASMKYDLEDELVYVFTPKGDIYELPYGSIPLDFAYRVHTEV
ncbi:MAG: bifunctional (p)ppGpp synthetase/guanosine-3',5'-bis(diphosphate) 3'-pyrophosphohydrolase, partial [Firmicutes bacterium]|nr:bifunctional (p)ppGpp synthetase/guanosine-3',5'-bis(diphosphate) 3'-pyrophosphohydrolase [Bacillota bacterium]